MKIEELNEWPRNQTDRKIDYTVPDQEDECNHHNIIDTLLASMYPCLFLPLLTK